MLVKFRQLIIYNKAIFGAAIVAFAVTLTEPEKYEYPNTPVLLRIKDKFFEYLVFRRGLYEAAWKITFIALERPLYLASRVNVCRGAVIAFASVLPDPDDTGSYECQYANTPVLQRILDEALPCSGLDLELQQAVKRIAICEMEHDPDHRAVWEFILEEMTEAYADGEFVFSPDRETDFKTAFEIIVKGIVESILDGEWRPRKVGWPGSRMWKEPRTENEGNHGGFRGYRFRQKINKN